MGNKKEPIVKEISASTAHFYERHSIHSGVSAGPPYHFIEFKGVEGTVNLEGSDYRIERGDLILRLTKEEYRRLIEQREEVCEKTSGMGHPLGRPKITLKGNLEISIGE